jgi:hypothetical protein
MSLFRLSYLSHSETLYITIHAVLFDSEALYQYSGYPVCINIRAVLSVPLRNPLSLLMLSSVPLRNPISLFRLSCLSCSEALYHCLGCAVCPTHKCCITTQAVLSVPLRNPVSLLRLSCLSHSNPPHPCWGCPFCPISNLHTGHLSLLIITNTGNRFDRPSIQEILHFWTE